MANVSQPVSITRSGGVEGSSESLELPSLSGGTVTFRYEHYTIPDHFIIEYHGEEYVDTGFTGGNGTGSFHIPAGHDDAVSIVVATDNDGTEWTYTVDFTPDDENRLAVPPPYSLVATSGAFQDSTDEKSSTLTSGESSFGRTDGNANLLDIVATTQTYTKGAFKVSGANVKVAGLSTKLFSGAFAYDFAAGHTISLADTNDGTDFKMAGLDVTVKSFSMTSQDIHAEVAFTLPTVFGGARVDTAALPQTYLLLDNSGARFWQPIEGSFIGAAVDVGGIALVGVKTSLYYKSNEDALILSGSFTVDVLKEKLRGKALAFKFNDDDEGIKYTTKGTFIKGSLTYANYEEIDGFGLSNFEIDIDTEAGSYGGSVDVTLPFLHGRGLHAGLGILVNPLRINKVEFGVSGLDLNVNGWLTLDSVTGTLDHLSDSSPLSVMGQIGFDVGGNHYKHLGTLDVSATVDKNSLTGKGELVILNPSIFEATVSATYNWNAGTFVMAADADLFSGTGKFKGILQGSANELSAYLVGEISSKNLVPLIGSIGAFLLPGDIEFGAQLRGSLSDDGNDGNDILDFALKYGTLSLGFEYNLRSQHAHLINYDEISPPAQPAQAQSLRAAAASAGASSQFSVASGSDTTIFAAKWANATKNVDFTLVKPDGTVIHRADFAANNITLAKAFTSYLGIGVIVNAADAGTWTARIDDTSTLGTVTFGAFAGGHASTLAFKSVATSADGSVAITIDNADLDPHATIQLFRDTNNSKYDGIAATDAIEVDELATDSAGNPILTWDTRSAPQGDYSLYAVLRDPDSTFQQAYAPGTVHVAGAANLTVKLTPQVSAWTSGTPVVYTIDVANTGTRDAADVVLELDRLSGSYLSSSTGFGYDSSGGYDVTDFSLGAVQAGTHRTGTVSLSTPYNNVGDLRASVGVRTSSQEISVADNNAYSALSQNVPAPTDLLVAVKVVQKPTRIRDALVYQVIVKNAGRAVATGIHINGFTSAVPGSVTGNGSIQLVSPTYGQEGFQIDLPSLAGGATAVWTVSGTAIFVGTYTSDVQVSSANHDTNLDNNRGKIALPITPSPIPIGDVSLAVTAQPVSASGKTTVTVRLTNEVATIENGVVVRLTLPAGMDASNFRVDQGVYDPRTGLWTIGNVVDAVNRTLTFDAVGIGSKTITAEVVDLLSPDVDSRPGNGVASEDDQSTLQIDFPVVADQAPTAVTLDGTHSLVEGRYGGTVGILTLVDPDASETATFRIVDDPSALFHIYGNTLSFTGYPDFEVTPSYSLSVLGIDSHGQTIKSTFKIGVEDVDGATKNGSTADDNSWPATSEEDHFDGLAGNDSIYGNDGNDQLIGNVGNDTLYGSYGDDVLTGGAGGDYLDGGSGVNDVARFDNAVKIDLLDSSKNTGDAIGDRFTNIEIYQLYGKGAYFYGSDNAETVQGGAGRDRLYGRDGNDTIDGGAGDDFLYGDNGDDRLIGGIGADSIVGGAGFDTAVYQKATTLDRTDASRNTGDAAGDSFDGVEGFEFADTADTFVGSVAAERVSGGGGNDSIDGGGGDDVLVGGGGYDLLTGGAGHDTFVYRGASDSGAKTYVADRITDFVQGEDKIDVSAFDGHPLEPGFQHLSFVGAGAFSGIGQIRASVSGSDTLVQFNLDGNNAAESVITLAGKHTLTAADFAF